MVLTRLVQGPRVLTWLVQGARVLSRLVLGSRVPHESSSGNGFSNCPRMKDSREIDFNNVGFQENGSRTKTLLQKSTVLLNKLNEIWFI